MRSFLHVLLLAAATLAPSTVALAQVGSLEELPPPLPTPETVAISFRLLTSIDLPGPLPGTGPRLVGDRVEIPVAGSVARIGWEPGATPRFRPTPDLPDPLPDAAWVESADGRVRFRALPSGLLLAEKKCKRCRRGWKKKWKLRVASSTPAPPLVTRKRVYFGAMDNLVYSVKRKNGHRVWSADLSARVTRGLVLWESDDLPAAAVPERERSAQNGASVAIILVVPDPGKRMVALSARTGLKLAAFPLEEDEGSIVGSPLLTPDGKVIVAHQQYARSQASLMVFELTAAQSSATPADPSPGTEPVAAEVDDGAPADQTADGESR